MLGMLEHLGDELALGVVGLGTEPEPKVCSGHRFSEWCLLIYDIIVLVFLKRVQ